MRNVIIRFYIDYFFLENFGDYQNENIKRINDKYEATEISQLALIRSNTLNTWVIISLVIGGIGIVVSCLSLGLQFRRK